MGESFSTFSATVQGGTTVNCAWPVNAVKNINSLALQRAPYGNNNAFVNVATPAASATSASDTPGAGNWVYRLKVISGNSLVYSNVVHVTLVPSTGRIVTSVATAAAPSPLGYTKVSVTWSSLDVEPRYMVWRARGSDPARLVARVNGVHGMIFEEVIRTGSGVISYFVQATLPPEGVGSQAGLTQSNTVAVSV